MNALWRLGKVGRSSKEEAPPVAWPPLRTLADFATEATFTAPHSDDELFARRLWRNVEYYQTNYICLLGVGVLLSVATDSFALVRLVGLALGFVVIVHVAADRGALPTEVEVRRRWLRLVDNIASRVRGAPDALSFQADCSCPSRRHIQWPFRLPLMLQRGCVQIGAAADRGRPEPTAAVSAVVVLCMLALGLVFWLCKMRWAIWAWVRLLYSN